MENMVCFECVEKHLAGALSYAKEIKSGHGKDSELDHRPDFLGQVVNAEHHLEQFDEMQSLFEELSAYRKQLQSREIQITTDDIDFLRSFFLKVGKLKNSNVKSKKSYYYEAPTAVDVVYIEPANLEWFSFSLESVKKYLVNYEKIYVLNPAFDCSDFGVEVVNQPLVDFAKNDFLAENFLVMGENQAFLKPTDAKKITPTYTTKRSLDFMKTVAKLRKKGISKTIFCCDGIKPQPVNKEIFNTCTFETEYVVTEYFYQSDFVELANNLQVAVEVEKPICCGTKTGLKTKHFASWNENGFQHFVDFMNQ